MVDVLYLGSCSIKQETTLQPGATKKYVIPAGTGAIWINHPGGTWQKINQQSYTQCQEATYSYEYCRYGTNNYAKEILVVNHTGITIRVDVYSNDWAGELDLAPNQTAHYYNVRAGLPLRFAAKVLPDGNWVYSDQSAVAKCATFTFPWIPKSTGEAGKLSVKETSEYNPVLPLIGTPISDCEPRK